MLVAASILQARSEFEPVGPAMLLIFGVVAIAVYLVPSIIAYRRRHEYRHVILGINVVGGVFILGWLVAFVWAVWPSERSLADPLIGNVTGKGQRNVGDTVGSAAAGLQRGFHSETNVVDKDRR